MEELQAERGLRVDHVTVYRSVQRFTPLFADAARPLRLACVDGLCCIEHCRAILAARSSVDQYPGRV
jgi:hypothetical protein